MRRRCRELVALAFALAAAPAAAEPECNVAANVWELELAQVAAESGSPDLQAIADALGMHATLRGGYRDPAHPKEPTRALLSAPSEGIGLNVMLETPP